MYSGTTIYSFATRNYLITALRLDDEPGDILGLDDETADALDNGTLDRFAVLVQVFRRVVTSTGRAERLIELGSDLLSGCIYASADEFVTNHRRYKARDYFGDMIREAIANARETQKALCS